MPVRTGEDDVAIDDVPIVGALPSSAGAHERGGDMEPRPNHERVVSRMLVLAWAAFALVLTSNLLSLGVDHLQTTLINANWEFSWSHDVDTILLGIGVWTSLVGARAGGADRRLWLATAAILALLFLDELSALHGQVRNLDKLLYAPILAALVVCVWRLTAATHERTLIVYALITLLLAFAMHVAGLHLLRPIGYTTYVYQAGVGFKEGTELAGLTLLVAALWRRTHLAVSSAS